MEIQPEIITLIWFAGIGIFTYFVIHKFSDVIKHKIKHQKKAQISSGEGKDVDEQLTSFIQNAPRLLTEIHQEMENQRANGVTDEQMAGLVQKKKSLEFLVQNKEIIEILGKPILKKVLGFIKAI